MWKFRKIADTNTAVPAGAGNFTGFSTPSIDGGNVAFQGYAPGHEGIYLYDSGTIKVIADTNTAVPGGTGKFTLFSSYPSIDGGKVVFAGEAGSSGFGIYIYDGMAIKVIADSSTTLPGMPGAPTTFNYPFIDRGDVIFKAESTDWQGIYKIDENATHVVADLNTAIPGGNGNFGYLFDSSIDNGSVVFAGRGNKDGIYLCNAGAITVVADTSTSIHGGTGNFEVLTKPSIDAAKVAFRGSGSNGKEIGLYSNLSGELSAIIDLNSTLDGKSLSNLHISHFLQGLSGKSVVFFAAFTDGSNGIYRADYKRCKFCPPW